MGSLPFGAAFRFCTAGFTCALRCLPARELPINCMRSIRLGQFALIAYGLVDSQDALIRVHVSTKTPLLLFGRIEKQMIIKGKTAFVTGGASGIGLATARRLAREGASVAIADLDSNSLEHARKEVGEKTLALTVDVTDENQLRGALERTVKELGHLDIVHNNAGIGTGPPGYPHVEINQWKRVLDIDLYAVILGCHLAAPLMERSGGGVIINTASMAGLYPHPTDPIYGSAKAGVVA